MEELRAYPAPKGRFRAERDDAGVVVPLQLVTPAGTLSFRIFCILACGECRQ